MTVRIPRTGQIRLSGHISASFNQNSGSQTNMGNDAVTAACHVATTHSPTQRSMNDAHGVITALTLSDRYANTNYGTSTGTWPADIATFNSIYNKQDTRPDGALYSNSTSRSPSCEDYGTHGHQLNMWMYGSSPGAIYCQMNKQTGVRAGGATETINFRVELATSGNSFGWGCSSQYYLYSYRDGYLDGSRIDNISLPSISGTSSTWTTTTTGSMEVKDYPHQVLGYRGFTQYPGYNFRGAALRVRPIYLRLIATSGYA